MAKKTHEELEQYVKVYELDVVSTKLQNMDESLNSKLSTLIEQTKGTATKDDLNIMKERLESKMKDMNSRTDTRICNIEDWIRDRKSFDKKISWWILGIAATVIATIITGLIKFGVGL